MPGFLFGAENLLTTSLLLIGLLISVLASLYVKTSYNKYRKINNKKGLSGFEVARKILDKNNLNNIHIVEIRGELSDHYDPSRKVVRLSSGIFDDNSIASISVAAHEVGHAIQDKEGYIFMRIRAFLVPIVNIGSKLGYVAIFIGLIAGILDFLYIGIFLLLSILLFQLITLPVEFDASKKAIIELTSLNLIDSNEKRYSKSMLNAAAMTYVAAVTTTILQLLRLILIANNRRR